MESASKISIPPNVLDRICQTSLGCGLASSREIADGWFNTIHVMSLEDGRRAVLKVSPPPGFTAMRYERDILGTEIAVHRLLAAHGLKVPAVLAESGGGEGIDHPWFIMEFLEGQALAAARPALAPEARDQADAAVAAQTAAVNAIAGIRFGRWRDDHCSAASWSASFAAMVEDLLADARDRSVALPGGEAAIRALVADSRAALDGVAGPRLVLWDLHDGNVIVDPASAGLAGFLDTDRALWGDPLMEFYFRRLSGATEAWHAAYRAACAAAGRPHPADRPGAGRCLDLYELYLGLVMVVEVAYRGFGPEHEAWVRDYCAKAWEACQAAAG